MARTLTFDPITVPVAWHPDGAYRVAGTRIPIETVLTFFQQGSTPEQIVASFDSLTLADVYAVIAYYLQHRPELDAYLAESRAESDEMIRRIEADFPPDALRKRLRARKPAGQEAGRAPSAR